jgi:hypothetical protein
MILARFIPIHVDVVNAPNKIQFLASHATTKHTGNSVEMKSLLKGNVLL